MHEPLERLGVGHRVGIVDDKAGDECLRHRYCHTRLDTKAACAWIGGHNDAFAAIATDQDQRRGVALFFQGAVKRRAGMAPQTIGRPSR